MERHRSEREPININQTRATRSADHDRENADWGRFAHELAHSLVDAGAVLGEDIYSSDLIDPTVATASAIRPDGESRQPSLFQRPFHEATQLLRHDNSSSCVGPEPVHATYTLVAHGGTQNANCARRHLCGSRRRRALLLHRSPPAMDPPSEFDTNIPVSGTNNGGIVVTKVFIDQVNVNQELRFMSLLHDVARRIRRGDRGSRARPLITVKTWCR